MIALHPYQTEHAERLEAALRPCPVATITPLHNHEHTIKRISLAAREKTPSLSAGFPSPFEAKGS